MSRFKFRDALFSGRAQQELFHLRYVLLDAIHDRRASPDQVAAVAALRAQSHTLVAFTIAYNVPGALALLSDGMARFLPETPLVVCDNSDDPAAADAIRRFSVAAGRIYCRVPRAPLVKRHSSRSHASALNWVLHNLIIPSGVRRFATLDHDLVPLAPDDLSARIADQPCYGYVQHGARSRAWYLWPGYAIFDLDRIPRGKVNFGADRMLGLDTGGRMWTSLYRHMDETEFVPADVRPGFVPGIERARPHQIFDNWFHIGGVSYRGAQFDAVGVMRACFDADPDGLLASTRV
ncbi:hypothetical protein [Aquabacter spiritensis]|uniref:Glycosyl transferase family 2 n=1 Tax=Aquabacter spiritensis TaxID=933073 RepID=A0A4R3LUQ5_9HYPH|nr:hypothetical protein [Aquabacter spiritensis]TCT02395.1 hypothetical protein EDC64_11342 [Aquabacter spiritensis]